MSGRRYLYGVLQRVAVVMNDVNSSFELYKDTGMRDDILEARDSFARLK